MAGSDAGGFVMCIYLALVGFVFLLIGIDKLVKKTFHDVDIMDNLTTT